MRQDSACIRPFSFVSCYCYCLLLLYAVVVAVCTYIIALWCCRFSLALSSVCPSTFAVVLLVAPLDVVAGYSNLFIGSLHDA